jgi:putative transposase
MAHKKRIFIRNSLYHIYNRGNNKEDIFKRREDKAYFINLLYEYRKRLDIYLDSITIMQNHYHLIIRTGRDPYIVSKYMQRVATAYAMYYNNKYKRTGHVFEGRYNCNYLRFKKDAINARHYIKQNAVKEGYVKKADNYPWVRFNK